MTAGWRKALAPFLPAAVFGIGSGLVYALTFLVLRVGFGRFTHGGPYTLLLSPLANVLMFAALAAALALGAALLRRSVMVLAVGVFAGLGMFAAMLTFPRVHQYASMFLALGAAVQCGRAYRRDPQRVTRALRVALPVLSGIWLAFGLGELGYNRWRGSRTPSARAAAGAPNVLLLILDTVRSSDMSLYGYDRATTPALERWAREGVVFDNAIAPSSWTLPSHASMFTGRAPDELTTDWRRGLDDQFPTLAERLYGAGYATGGFVANVWYAGSESGLGRGFMRYEDYPLSLHQLLWSSTLIQAPVATDLLWGSGIRGRLAALARFEWRNLPTPTMDRKDAARVQRDFLRWQATVGDRPFFAFLNYYDAHDPYRAPPDFRARFTGGDQGRDEYDASVAYIDEQIDGLLRGLRDRGVLDRTLVIVTADHGELFGEHGLRGHGNGVYRPVLHVPLYVRLPGRVPAGIRVTSPTALQDLSALILTLTGAAGHDSAAVLPWSRDSVAATSAVVRSYFEGDPDWTVGRKSGRGPDLSLTTDQLHYIKTWKNEELLFAYRSDTGEVVNLLNTPAGERLVAPFRPLVTGRR